MPDFNCHPEPQAKDLACGLLKSVISWERCNTIRWARFFTPAVCLCKQAAGAQNDKGQRVRFVGFGRIQKKEGG